MKKTILLLTLLGSFSIAWADDATHREAAAAFLEAQRTDQLIRNANEQRKASYAEQVKNLNTSPQTAKLLDDYMIKLSDVISRSYNWQKVKPDFIDAYAAVYTEEELRAMTGFFLSPAGQALMNKQADVNARVVNNSHQYMQAMQNDVYVLRARLAEDYQALKEKAEQNKQQKAGDKKTSPAAPPKPFPFQSTSNAAPGVNQAAQLNPSPTTNTKP